MLSLSWLLPLSLFACFLGVIQAWVTVCGSDDDDDDDDADLYHYDIITTIIIMSLL